MSLENQINQLKNTYNATVSILIKNTNDAIRSIVNSNVYNKNGRINAIQQQFKIKVNALYVKLMSDIEKLKMQAQAPPVPTPVPTPVPAPVPAPVPEPVPIPVPTPVVKNKKYGLLVGINYIGTQYELRGCINDIDNVKNKLVSSYGYNDANIVILTDNTTLKPTKSVILDQFKNVFVNSVAGDQIFFAFSGHGSNVLDRNGDEKDGYDEMIVTKDLQGILDDDLNALIKQYLKKDVTLFALFDSCHSGTILDLKYQYLDSTDYNHSTINDKVEETVGNVYMISGCMDAQTSADAYINNKSQGAMTWSFLETLNTKTNLSWNELVVNMRALLKTKYQQIPQFSCGKNVDFMGKFMI